jgi:hypothetical protein
MFEAAIFFGSTFFWELALTTGSAKKERRNDVTEQLILRRPEKTPVGNRYDKTIN